MRRAGSQARQNCEWTWRPIFEFFKWDFDSTPLEKLKNGNWIFRLSPDQTKQLNDFLNAPYGNTCQALNLLKSNKQIKDLVLTRAKKPKANLYWAARPVFDFKNEKLSSQECNHYMLEKAIKALL